MGLKGGFMIQFTRFFLCACFFSVPVFGSVQIKVSVNYTEIFQHVHELGQKYGSDNVLVVFDLDDTILVTRDCEIDGKEIKGFRKLFVCPSKYAEKDLEKNISKIQQQGFPVLALTARGGNLLRATERELSRDRKRGNQKISFDLPPFSGVEIKNLQLPRRKSKCYQRNPVQIPCVADKMTTGIVERGVFYSAGGHKAKSLKILLKELGLSYERIIFIDDKYYNIFNFRDEFQENDSVQVDAFLYLRHRK